MPAIYAKLTSNGILLTTQPYPVELADALAITGSVQSVIILPVSLEEHDVILSILNGTLRTLLNTHIITGQEEHDVGVTIRNGTMTILLSTHTVADQEEHDVVVSILDGTITILLITITLDPEAFDVSGSVVDITIT